MTDFTWAAKRTDGTDTTLKLSNGTITEVTATPPVHPGLPQKFNTLRVNDNAWIHIDGMNIDRGVKQCIVYTDPVAYAKVNKWGVDVLVDIETMQVIAIRDREHGSATGFGDIFSGATEFIVSGHFTAGTWLLSHLKVGTKIELVQRDNDTVTPPVDDGGTSVPITGGKTSTWYMIWPDSAKVHVNTSPAEDFDILHIAFSNDQGNPLVGDGPFGLDILRRELQYLVAKKRRISLSFGGGGGYTTDGLLSGNLSDVVKRAEDRLQIPITGINWDDERSSFRIDRAIAASRKLKNERGDFYVSWSPDGTTKWLYRDALVNAPDVVDELAFQCYYKGWGKNEVDMSFQGFLQGNKLKPEQLGLGMMTGDNTVWTLDECKQWAQYAHDKYGCRKFFLWEVSRTNTSAWVTFMNALKVK